MAKISVIVPVYNVEKYIKQSLDSIINQTLNDIEIICVNDGSTDSSREILEQYKQKDSRIIIIDKKNGGLSSARNAGMEVAKGEFISFIDSDDWVKEDFLEKLYNNITTYNSDISICAVNQYDETKQDFISPDKYFTLEYFDKSFDNRAFSYTDTKEFLMNVCVMAWNKLYRRSFLESTQARFPDGLIFEDGPFFFSIFFKTQKVSIVRDRMYNYRINRNGSIVQKGGIQFFDIIDVVNMMLISLKNSPIFNEVKYEFFHRKADDIIYRYELIGLKLKNKFSKKLKKESLLLDENIFDFAQINEKFPITYRNFISIKHKTGILSFYWRKFVIRFMYKVMQVLYTEENIYYFKFWDLKFRLKKRANLYDIWYENDRIYVVLFMKIKFNFKFEYSKLEKNRL